MTIKKINFITHHGFPFRRFNSTPEENLNVYQEFSSFIDKYKNRIVTGDFNAENPQELIPGLKNMYEVENESTTTDGMRFDKIYIDNEYELYDYEFVKLYSDHYLLIVTLK